MQLFRSEDDIEAWVDHTGNPCGAVFSPEQLWELSKGWWDDRLLLDWKRKSVEERQRLLERCDLRGPFWDLSAA